MELLTLSFLKVKIYLEKSQKCLSARKFLKVMCGKLLHYLVKEIVPILLSVQIHFS